MCADIPALRPWLQDLLRTRLHPLVSAVYPRLADGSTPGDMGDRVRVHDAFVVRYDAENDKSYSLPEHADTSAVQPSATGQHLPVAVAVAVSRAAYLEVLV